MSLPIPGSFNTIVIYIATVIFYIVVIKIEDVLEDQFGFRTGKGTRHVIGMTRIIAERT